MPSIRRAIALSAVLTSGVSVTWSHFNSTTYPYTITQPSSYRHIVLRDTANRQVDYFFPSLGSFTTNVNVYAFPGATAPDEMQYLRSMGGQHVQRAGWLRLAGSRRQMVRADFRGVTGRWTMMQTDFVAHGLVWRLTASYDVRYSKLRGTLMRILRSFQLQGTTAPHRKH